MHLAKTGEVIVIHDPVVNRVSDGDGFVKDLTLDEIRSFTLDPDPAGRYRDERIPTLKEVFERFGGKATLFIEMKRPGGTEDAGDGLEAKVGGLIDRFGLHDSTYVSSFNPASLGLLKKACPRARTVLEYHNGLPGGYPRTECLELTGGVHAVGPRIAAATPELAAWARDRGYALSTFGVRTLDDMERALALGFDLVTTYLPGIFRIVAEGRGLAPDALEALPLRCAEDFEKPLPGRGGTRRAGTGRGGRPDRPRRPGPAHRGDRAASTATCPPGRRRRCWSPSICAARRRVLRRTRPSGSYWSSARRRPEVR